MSLDRSRQYDLEQLGAMLQDPWRSKLAKHEIEEVMYKIINQSTEITYLREQLVRATRGGDTRAIKQLQHHIQAIRQQETKGKEF